MAGPGSRPAPARGAASMGPFHRDRAWRGCSARQFCVPEVAQVCHAPMFDTAERTTEWKNPFTGMTTYFTASINDYFDEKACVATRRNTARMQAAGRLKLRGCRTGAPERHARAAPACPAAGGGRRADQMEASSAGIAPRALVRAMPRFALLRHTKQATCCSFLPRMKTCIRLSLLTTNSWK